MRLLILKDFHASGRLEFFFIEYSFSFISRTNIRRRTARIATAYGRSDRRFPEHPADNRQQLLAVEWLLQKSVSPVSYRLCSYLSIVYCSHENEWNARIVFLDVQQQREAINLGQEQVR
jgi:hypothetical protein